jgi:hypothetical protein
MHAPSTKPLYGRHFRTVSGVETGPLRALLTPKSGMQVGPACAFHIGAEALARNPKVTHLVSLRDKI